MNTNTNEIPDSFYVVAKEPGAEHPALPTWAGETANPVKLEGEDKSNVGLVGVDEVPGTFQLLNVLSNDECRRFIQLTESLGYLDDAAVSLPRTVRHNCNVTWVVDEETDGIIWNRCAPLLNGDEGIFTGKKPLGLNARFRFYRYEKGDYFKVHTDGSWPGSRVKNKQLIRNAYPDRWSQMSVLIFLSEDFEGGSTQFWVNKDDSSLPTRDINQAKLVNVRTPAGSLLCFPHGNHPLHCLHSSEEIISGAKYIIRTDMLFEM